MDYYKFFKDKNRKEYTFSPAAFEGGWALGSIEAKELFEQLADRLKIPFYDECCEEEQQLTVRYNAANNTLEAYNPVSNEFEVITLGGTGGEPIPGPQGEIGPIGPAGADSTVPGPKGDKGDIGDSGADSTVPGPKGDKGDTGDIGPASTVPGPKGDTGDTGPAGNDGIDGSLFELNLTTIGNSGPANYDPNTDTLNVPDYTIEGDPFWIEVTRAEADALISTSSLIKGAKYKLLNVDIPLYGGTDVVLTTIAPNKFSLEGTGIFYNPKYNQALESYGIWHNLNTWATTLLTGTFNHNEAFTANNGVTGTLFSALGGNKFIVTSVSDAATINAITSITGNTTGATASVASVVAKVYAVNDTAIWGGKHWINTTGLVGTSTSSLLLDANWTVIPYNTTDYNQVLDFILYDYENDLIVRRQDKSGNVVEASKATVTVWANPRTIALFQWGNPYVESTVKGCGNNQVINGYVDNINMIGCFAHNIVTSKAYFIGNRTYLATFISNKLSGGSHISNNILLSSGINNNNLEKGNVGNNNFNGSNIAANSLHTSYILSNDLQITSTINSNILTNFGYIYNNFLLQSSVINSNNVNFSYIYNNYLSDRSQINSNVSTTGGAILTNKLHEVSKINSNIFAAGSIRANEMHYASEILSNNLTGSNTFIYINKMSSTARINTNTLNNAYIVRNNMLGFAEISGNTVTGSTGSNAATISTNNMISGDIQFNTLNGIRADIFGNNLIVPLGYTDTPGRAKIEYNSITTANGRIELCTLEAGGVIRNVNINANALKVRKVDLYQQILDMNNLELTRDYEHNQLLSVTGRHTFKVTFDGNTGRGAVGFLNLPNYPVPTGYFIESVLVDVGTGLTGASVAFAIFNLGIEVDDSNSGLTDLSGEVGTLNTNGVTKVNPSVFTKATTNRKLIIEIRQAPITGGTATFTVNLAKLT